jgi:hypothetical protein
MKLVPSGDLHVQIKELVAARIRSPLSRAHEFRNAGSYQFSDIFVHHRQIEHLDDAALSGKQGQKVAIIQ